jgi:hypothetical protein
MCIKQVSVGADTPDGALRNTYLEKKFRNVGKNTFVMKGYADIHVHLDAALVWIPQFLVSEFYVSSLVLFCYSCVIKNKQPISLNLCKAFRF